MVSLAEPGQGLRRRAAQLHARDPAAGRAGQRAGAGQRERRRWPTATSSRTRSRPSARSSSASWPTTAGSSARSPPAAPTFTTAQERKSARFLEHNLATYRSVTSELFGVSRANTPELAYEWSSQRLDPAADTLSADLEDLYDAKVAEGDALAHEATGDLPRRAPARAAPARASSSSSPSRPAWSPSAASASASRRSSRAWPRCAATTSPACATGSATSPRAT